MRLYYLWNTLQGINEVLASKFRVCCQLTVIIGIVNTLLPFHKEAVHRAVEQVLRSALCLDRDSKSPILNNMDHENDRKSEENILEAFKTVGLKCCQELMDLYLWKTGCTKELIFDLSEDENEWNHFLLCSYGNYASYEVSRDIMFQNKSYNAVYAGDHYMYPFMYCGVYEDPILIDLNPCRETYKAMFYYSPEVTFPRVIPPYSL